ncbi:MAG TPA: TIGR03435 family protein [Bryobacteraceae bacterium]|nr:TIGR03435 family protein [Bryobacteraceae bacterium]
MASSLLGQTPAAAPTFDVASIKPSEPITPAMVQAGKLHAGMKIDGARVDIGNFTLLQLITKAYDVKTYQVQGPSWMTPMAQRFDVVANLPPGATKDQVPQMLQALLAERFKLVIHRDTKEHNVYALVVAKGGPKIAQTPEPAPAADGAAAPNPAITGSNSLTISQSKGGAAEVSDGAGLRQKMTPSADGKSVRFEISKASMALLAEGLSPLVDRPIVDMTELKGNYDVAFEVSMQELMNAARATGAAVPQAAPTEAASDPGGSIFTAIQSLGLKLEPRKAPLLMIVVDKAEKMPTDN